MTVSPRILDTLPSVSKRLFQAKSLKKLSFNDIGTKLGRDEVSTAAIFYGQTRPSKEDIASLSSLLDIDKTEIEEGIGGFPDRGKLIEFPPRDPTIYRLFEMCSVYGYPYKSIIHEKFGDGIMSAISFSTKIEKEEDENGTWVKITQRGKWLPYTRF